jgi:hypothetical protein
MDEQNRNENGNENALRDRIREYLETSGYSFEEDGDSFTYRRKDVRMTVGGKAGKIRQYLHVIEGDQYQFEICLGPILPPFDGRASDMMDLSARITDTMFILRAEFDDEEGVFHATANYDTFDGLPSVGALKKREDALIEELSDCKSSINAILAGGDVDDAYYELLREIGLYDEDDEDDGEDDADEDWEEADELDRLFDEYVKKLESGEDSDTDKGSILHFPGTE